MRGLDHLGGVLLANASPVMQMTSYLPAQTCSSRAPYRVLSTLYFQIWYAGLLELAGYAYDPGQVCRMRVCLYAAPGRAWKSLAQTRHGSLPLPSISGDGLDCLKTDGILSYGNRCLQLHVRVNPRSSKIQRALAWVPSI